MLDPASQAARWQQMSHPSGAQVWSAHLGKRPEDSWRGFIALEGYPVCPDNTSAPKGETRAFHYEMSASREPLSKDVLRKIEDTAEVWLAMLAGRPLPRYPLELEDVDKLLRWSRDHKQPGSLGDWIEGHIYRIDRAQARADEQEQKRLQPLLKKLREAKKYADEQREDRRKNFMKRCSAGHTGHDLVFAERVARMVRDMNVKVVVLTTCRGGVRGVSRWSGLAAALLRAGVPVVVAMQFAISIDAAKRFSLGFYDALALGKSIDEAVTEGRKNLQRDPGQKGFDDFGLPVIYSRLTRTVSLRLPKIPSPL